MIDLGSTEFLFAAPPISESELKSRTTQLFDEWEAHIHRSLALPDYSLFLQVEEGSIKGGGAIAAMLGALYIGIGNYGDFVQGLKTIGEQIGSASDYLAEHASQAFDCRGAETSTRKRGGAISSLQRLFVKVQRGEITPEEATARAEGLLGEEARAAPGFMESLSDSLEKCPRFHQQVPLPLGDSEHADPNSEGAPAPKQPSRPAPVIGPILHLRFEIWRESKTKRRKSRVTQI